MKINLVKNGVVYGLTNSEHPDYLPVLYYTASDAKTEAESVCGEKLHWKKHGAMDGSRRFEYRARGSNGSFYYIHIMQINRNNMEAE